MCLGLTPQWHRKFRVAEHTFTMFIKVFLLHRSDMVS